MNIKFKSTIGIRNFLVVLYACFCYATIEGASLEKAEVAEVDGSLTFTPRCLPILQTEFNPVARALYEDCINRQSIAGKNALDLFKRTYPKLSDLNKSLSSYIENIHLVQTALYTFIETLNEMKLRHGTERLLPAIAARECLVLAVAHCAFDFDNCDLYMVTKMYLGVSHWLKSSKMISEIKVDSIKGTILRLNGTPNSEDIFNDHPLFGELCQKTITFIEALKKIAPVIERLSSTARLKEGKAAEKKEEEKK